MEPHIELWRTRSLVEKYRGMQGWIDEGERIAVNSIADEVRCQGILDLGVGAGRTAWLLRLLTADYVALDWSPEMVDACRFLCPGTDVRRGDARDLSEFPTSRFKMVFFSYNGIDNLGHDDRIRVFDAVERVLQPDGLFVYSTLSKLGRAYMERPQLAAKQREGEPAVKFAARLLYRLLTRRGEHERELGQWERAKTSAQDHGDWAIAPLAALGFEMAHFTTIAAETKTLAGRGLQIVSLISDDGRALTGDASECTWFHVVARKENDGSPST